MIELEKLPKIPKIPTIRASGFTKMLLGLAIIAAIFYFTCVAIIPAGHVGVVDRLGIVSDQEMAPGFNFKDPIAGVHPMTTKVQQHEYQNIRGTLTNEGLEVIMDASVQWHLDPSNASDIYKTVSGEYFDTLLTPAFMGILRDEVKRYTGEAIYTQKSTAIQTETENRLRDELGPRGLIIDRVWLRGITLPSELTDRIKSKLGEEQEVQKMGFTVEKQKKEAERLLIEADAQAAANQMIGTSISDTLVNWEIAKALNKNQGAVYVLGGGTGNILLNTGTPNPKS
ncbi:MAG: prohibitin family protein [Methanotrichaceae archaeon]|nr:prohibitin family protein [Methanotrichaceae archaeon]